MMRLSVLTQPTETIVVALIGNPNTGKTTLFNALTGHRQRVGNYPGVTVDKKSGFLRHVELPDRAEVIDLPGAYSLSARSADEALLMDVLLGRHEGEPAPSVVISVIDAANLSRNLFLLSQVLELGKPVIVALNMMDLAEASGVRINVEGLSRELGVPVVPVVANKGRGIEELARAVASVVDTTATHYCPSFPECICAELDGLKDTVGKSTRDASASTSRPELLQSLLDPGGYHETRLIRHCGRRLAEELAQRRRRIEESGESIAEVEARIRYTWIGGVIGRVVTRAVVRHCTKSEIADRMLTNRFAGTAVLLLLMGMCFQSIYAWAAPLMDAVDGLFQTIGQWASGVMPSGALQSLLIDGVIAGVGAVLVFLPQILILFLFIAILEDCGYMARAAFLLDRWMSLVGLNGKAFIPLLSSFACAVPGIMAARTIENPRDRLTTILIAPLMSCSARLPVYILLIAAFIPPIPLLGGVIGLQAVTLLGMYLLGTIVAVPVAWLLHRTLLRGKSQAFLMELPTYKWPSASTVLYRIYEQGREFCLTAGTIIFLVTIVIWALGYYPHPASIEGQAESARQQATARYEARLAEIDAAHPEHSEIAAEESVKAQEDLTHELTAIKDRTAGEFLSESTLGRLGRWIEPVVQPLGWDWRIGTAAIASFPAREVFIATMGTIYNLGGETDESSKGLRDMLRSARDPSGRPLYNVAVALSLMVFFALCCQCGGTLAAIKRETKSWRWPLFTFAYMTALAYVGAFITYQAAARFTG